MAWLYYSHSLHHVNPYLLFDGLTQAYPGISRHIYETAFQVGFGNLSHFNHVFRRSTGLSPTKHRQQHTSTRIQHPTGSLFLGVCYNEDQKRRFIQHRDMARLACDAWWQAGWNCSADLGRPWSARALYHFEVLHDLPEPTHIIDVTDSFQDKVRAWEKFKSVDNHLSSMAAQMEARARYHGSKIGVKYAEVLQRSFFIPQKVVQIKEL